MPNVQKKQEVANLEDLLEDNNIFFFTNYQGLDVPSMNQIRRKFESSGVQMRVFKNRLFKIAYEHVKESSLEKDYFLNGPTAMVFTREDPVTPAKIIEEALEEFGKPEIKAILIEDDIKDASYFEQLTSIPSVEKLQGKLVGSIAAPLTSFLNVLNAPMRDLVYALKDLKEQKAENNN